jgi:hypothetical protein
VQGQAAVRGRESGRARSFGGVAHGAKASRGGARRKEFRPKISISGRNAARWLRGRDAAAGGVWRGGGVAQSTPAIGFQIDLQSTVLTYILETKAGSSEASSTAPDGGRRHGGLGR